MAVTDDQVIKRLRVLLGESDLQTTTEKMLRKKLEEEFKTDMTDKKAIIRREIEKYLEEQAANEEEEEDEGEEEEEDEGGNTRAKGSSLGCLLSEPLQKFLGSETLPRTQVVKRIWEYIKANNLQDPKDRRKILLDDKLKTLFTSPLTMFSMNTQLSKHCKTMDAADLPRSRPAKTSGDKRTEKPKADKPKPKKAKAGEGDTKDKEEGKKNNFNKPVRLDAELQSWTGSEAMGRADLTKFFWTYVKEHKLQDPSNKQYVNCDAVLKKLTGESRIQAFGIHKYLANHILKD